MAEPGEGPLSHGGMRNPRFDTRAILALIAIVGAFGYQILMLWMTEGNVSANVQIPSWMSAIAMGVTGFYFGSRAAEGGNGNGKK